MRRSFLIGLLLSLLMATAYISYAYWEMSSGKYRGYDYYVSDEVWYATSARNLLKEVFGVNAKYVREGYAYATLVFTSNEFLEEHLSDVVRCLSELDGSVVRANYTETGDKVPLLWVRVPESNLSKLEGCGGAIKVIPGFEYPSKKGIHDYLNLEHPPLGKYLIMASIILFGDEPMSWRLPGLIEGFIMVILVYLIGSRLLNPFWGVVASLALVLDPMFVSMSMVAMLDIHLAFFTTLALLFVVYDRPLAASVAGWVAFSVKFSGLFVVLAVYLYIRIYGRERVLPSLVKALAPAVTYILISIPVISYLGVDRWIIENLNAAAWHTTSRGSGPTPSPPWGWFFNLAPMALHYNPDLIARVNLVSYAFVFAFSFILLPALLERRREYIPMLFVGSIVLGYTAVFLKGNRTLYSFYAVQLSSAVAVSFSVIVAYLSLWEGEVNRYLSEGWKRISRALLGEGLKLPEELPFLRPLLAMDTRSLSLSLGILTAAFSSLVLYYMAFMPTSPAALLGLDDIGLSNVLTHYLTESSSELWIRGAAYGTVVMLSSLIILLDLYEGSGGITYAPLLAVLLLSSSDWTLLAVALAMDSMMLARRGRRLSSSVLLGISGAVNPLTLTAAPLVISMNGRIYALGVLAGLILPMLIPGSIHWPSDVTGGLLRPLLGEYSLLAGLIAALITILIWRDERETTVISAGVFLLIAGGRPYWSLISLFMVSMMGGGPGLALMELAASIPVLSWVTPKLISGPLFKCDPAGPADPCSDPFIALTLLSLALVYWGVRRILLRRGYHRYAGEGLNSPSEVTEGDGEHTHSPIFGLSEDFSELGIGPSVWDEELGVRPHHEEENGRAISFIDGPDQVQHMPPPSLGGGIREQGRAVPD
ncbi:MAG: glycosyltransferase family 39 protein [Candidatus Korarchaeota archaeon]|nr:glycosyltransferase family 39 protein [Candidatus Korarchaeota archaeon]